MKKGVVLILTVLLLFLGTSLAETPTGSQQITFTENPTTGYTWQVKSSDEGILSIQDQGYAADPNPGDAVGTGGTHTWNLLGQAEGDATATFTYGQGWEGGQTGATVEYACHVATDMSIEFTVVTGIPALYMPDKAAVLLLENPTTGYQWTCQMSAEGILTLEQDEYLPPAEALEGAGGQHLWVWSGAKAGDVTLTFAYARSFEPDVAPDASVTYTFSVDADGRVHLREMGGDYASYDPALALPAK